MPLFGVLFLVRHMLLIFFFLFFRCLHHCRSRFQTLVPLFVGNLSTVIWFSPWLEISPVGLDLLSVYLQPIFLPEALFHKWCCLIYISA